MSVTHLAFSDDSGQKRYHSLSLCTFEAKHEESLFSELDGLLKLSAVSEFKWEKLRSAKYRFAAERIINFVFKHLDKLRIDTIIWDYEDSRHRISQRDDNENRVRMYYHLTSTTMSRRWLIAGTKWQWKPDEQSAVDWNTLWDCLQLKKHKCVQDLFNENPDFEKVKLERPIPSKSSENCFIQVADLFAGIGAYSWECFDSYYIWSSQVASQQQNSLFDSEILAQTFTDAEEERFRMLKLLRDKCGENRLQVSLNSSRGLKSNLVTSPINFWLYTPRVVVDKAPVKKK